MTTSILTSTNDQRHSCIVPGLDMLIGDPDILRPKADTPQKARLFCIPKIYIRRLNDFYDEPSTRGEASKELVEIISNLLEHSTARNSRNPIYVCQLENGTHVEFHDVNVYDEDRRHPSSKIHAIQLAKEMCSDYYDTAIMTGSDKLSVLAALEGLDVAHINPHVYTGRVRVPLYDDTTGLDLTSAWWSNHRITGEEWHSAFPDIHLKVNQYVEFDVDESDQESRLIGYYDGYDITPIHYRRPAHPRYHMIKPQTIGQQMLFDAILASPDEIPIVIASGIFGTGKTFSALACGLSQVESGVYEKIFVCPRDSTLGKDIGYLPGDETEKTRAKARAIIDNLREILRLTHPGKNIGELNRLVEKYLDEYFEFVPTINMEGSSISRSFIIFDEFQDTERYQAKALLSRIGNHSKMAVLGDPTQLANPHLNRTSNGLSYAASRLADSPVASVVTFNKSDEIVRSKAAQAIAELLR